MIVGQVIAVDSTTPISVNIPGSGAATVTGVKLSNASSIFVVARIGPSSMYIDPQTYIVTPLGGLTTTIELYLAPGQSGAAAIYPTFFYSTDGPVSVSGGSINQQTVTIGGGTVDVTIPGTVTVVTGSSALDVAGSVTADITNASLNVTGDVAISSGTVDIQSSGSNTIPITGSVTADITNASLKVTGGVKIDSVTSGTFIDVKNSPGTTIGISSDQLVVLSQSSTLPITTNSGGDYSATLFTLPPSDFPPTSSVPGNTHALLCLLESTVTPPSGSTSTVITTLSVQDSQYQAISYGQYTQTSTYNAADGGFIVSGYYQPPIQSTTPFVDTGDDIVVLYNLSGQPSSTYEISYTVLIVAYTASIPQGTELNVAISNTAVGGDLSGQYPDPLVVGLQGVPISSTPPFTNQVLEYNGLQWAPATASSGGPLDTYVSAEYTSAINVPSSVNANTFVDQSAFQTTFVAPPNGQVFIQTLMILFIENTTYCFLNWSDSSLQTFGMTNFINPNSSGSFDIYSPKWFINGLTPGNSYTLFLCVSESGNYPIQLTPLSSVTNPTP